MANVNTTLIARAVCVALAMAGGVAARAQAPSDSNLDVTIRLLPENAVGPADITRRIELPPAAANPTPPRADAADGASSNNGRGEEISNEARERGREFGQETSERARENRENAGRPDDAGRPDNAGRPDDAGRPDNPGAPVEPPASPPASPPGGPPITPPGRP
jgi:hypothetical protein